MPAITTSNIICQPLRGIKKAKSKTEPESATKPKGKAKAKRAKGKAKAKAKASPKNGAKATPRKRAHEDD